MLGVNNILNSSGQPDTDEYYKLLHCDENASNEQINAEFKILALECHPDKNPEDSNALQKFQILQEARDTLTDPDKRRNYDKWRRSEVSIPFKQWIALSSRCQPTMHWAKPKTQIMLQGSGENDRKHDDDTMVESSGTGSNNDIRETKKSQWTSEPERGVYKQFRNYEI